MREWLEFAVAWLGIKSLGLLPRSVARFVGATFALAAYIVRTPLRRAATFNLHLAFPDWSEEERKQAIRGMVRQIGWMAGEFSQFPKYTRDNIERVVIVDGFENFDAGRRRGKGVLFLTGHAANIPEFVEACRDMHANLLEKPVPIGRIESFIEEPRP